MSPRTGRPKSDNPKFDELHIRVTSDEKKEIMDFHTANNVSLLDLIRLGMLRVEESKK